MSDVAEERKGLEAIVKHCAVILAEPWAPQDDVVWTFCFPLAVGAITGNCGLGKSQGRIRIDCEDTNNVFCSFASKAANLRKEESTKADAFLLSSFLSLSSCYCCILAARLQVERLQREQ